MICGREVELRATARRRPLRRSFRLFSSRQSGLRNLLYLFPRLWANDSTVQFFKPFPALVELRASGFTSPDGFICSTENLFRYRSGYFVHVCSCKQFVRKEQSPATCTNGLTRRIFVRPAEKDSRLSVGLRELRTVTMERIGCRSSKKHSRLLRICAPTTASRYHGGTKSCKVKPDFAQYGFVHQNNLIMACIGGSQAHGAKLGATDDTDWYGLYVPPPAKLLGLEREEHFVFTTGGN